MVAERHPRLAIAPEAKKGYPRPEFCQHRVPGISRQRQSEGCPMHALEAPEMMERQRVGRICHIDTKPEIMTCRSLDKSNSLAGLSEKSRRSPIVSTFSSSRHFRTIAAGDLGGCSEYLSASWPPNWTRSRAAITYRFDAHHLRGTKGECPRLIQHDRCQLPPTVPCDDHPFTKWLPA